MASSAQVDASRANGACSRGPVTVEGKARSAANSRKHGLCSRQLILEDVAEQEAFDALLAETVRLYEADCEPRREVCRHIAIAMWRRRVCDNLEVALLQAIERGEACAETGGDGLPSLKTLIRYRARLARDLREAEAELAALPGPEDVILPDARPSLAARIEHSGTHGTNEPETGPMPCGNRQQRRRDEALARKARRKMAAGQR